METDKNKKTNRLKWNKPLIFHLSIHKTNSGEEQTAETQFLFGGDS